MTRSGAMGCVVLFGACALGACSAGSGPVGVPLYGDREPVSTGRDDPGTVGHGATGATQAPAPQPTSSGKQSTPTPTPVPTGTGVGKPPSTATCPVCINYACTGSANGMPSESALNLTPSGMGACSDGAVTLRCDGTFTRAGGANGTWKSIGSGFSVDAPPDSLTCFPM